jgi:hypothetical protein
MELNPELKNLYDNYYGAQKESLQLKRDLTALQSVRNLKSLLPVAKVKNLIDIGAGDGNTLKVLADQKIAEEFSAIEISSSGIEAIKQRKIKGLVKVEMFDGYTIKEDADKYALGVVLHVLEHVEHERIFMREVLRVCESVYIEVPLENTFFIKSALKLSPAYGHINFYNAHTLPALMQHMNFKIKGFKVFSHSKEYEMLISGKIKGSIRHFVKSSFLKFFPKLAVFFFTYTGGILVSK